MFQQAEPISNGQPLSYWVEALAEGTHNEAERDKVVGAISQIGTNAVPFLMKWLQFDTPHWERAAQSKFSFIPGFVWEHSTRKEARASAAVWAFRVLPILGAGKANEFNTILLQRSGDASAGRAAQCLSAIGMPGLRLLLLDLDSTNSLVRYDAAFNIEGAAIKYRNELAYAIPALVSRITDSDPGVVIEVTSSLKRMRADQVDFTQALVANLGRSNFVIQLSALDAFGSLGTNATPFLPQIEPFLTANDLILRHEATNTVEKIKGIRPPRRHWE